MSDHSTQRPCARHSATRTRTDRAKAGFTLVEILAVVLIIAVLATLVGLQVAHQPGKAKIAAVTAQISTFRNALQLYRMNHGSLPTQEQGLNALCVKPTAQPTPQNYPAEGYLDRREIPRDPWGGEYVYLVPGSAGAPFEIICYGADGQPGGEGENADISSNNP